MQNKFGDLIENKFGDLIIVSSIANNPLNDPGFRLPESHWSSSGPAIPAYLPISRLENLPRERGFDFERWVASRSTRELSEDMYNGQGADSMRNAAQAWKDLNEKLNKLAEDHKSVIGRLLEEWGGESGKSWAAAAIVFVAWLQETAWAAKDASRRINQAAEAFDEARVRHVPLEAINANRARYTVPSAALLANPIDRNAQELLAIKGEYDTMRQQNIDALKQYFSEIKPLSQPKMSTRLTSEFIEPPQITKINAKILLWIAEQKLTEFADRQRQSSTGARKDFFAFELESISPDLCDEGTSDDEGPASFEAMWPAP